MLHISLFYSDVAGNKLLYPSLGCDLAKWSPPPLPGRDINNGFYTCHLDRIGWRRQSAANTRKSLHEAPGPCQWRLHSLVCSSWHKYMHFKALYIRTYINIHLSLSLHIQTSTTCLLQILNVCFPIPQMNILFEFGHHTLLVEVPFPLAAIPRFVSLCPLLLLWHFVLVCCCLLLVEDQSGPIGPTHSHLGKQIEELSAFVYMILVWMIIS